MNVKNKKLSSFSKFNWINRKTLWNFDNFCFFETFFFFLILYSTLQIVNSLIKSIIFLMKRKENQNLFNCELSLDLCSVDCLQTLHLWIWNVVYRRILTMLENMDEVPLNVDSELLVRLLCDRILRRHTSEIKE